MDGVIVAGDVPAESLGGVVVVGEGAREQEGALAQVLVALPDDLISREATEQLGGGKN